MIVCNLAFFAANVALDGGEQKTGGRILNGEFELPGKRTEHVFLEFGLNGIQPVAFGNIHMHAQDAFFFAARDGKNLMRLQTVHAGGEGIITFVHALFIRGAFDLFGAQAGKFERPLTRGGADTGIVADDFSHDVARALQGFLGAGNLLVDKLLCNFFGGTRVLFQDQFGQRIQALFTCEHGARAAFLFVRRVQVFERGHGDRGGDGGAQLVREFALLFNGCKDGGAPFIQRAQADEFVREDADLFVVERAGHFLAVTGNERDGVAFVKEVDDSRHLRRLDVKLGGDLFCVSHGGILS